MTRSLVDAVRALARSLPTFAGDFTLTAVVVYIVLLLCKLGL